MNRKVLFIVLTCIFVACGNKQVKYEEKALDVAIVTSDSVMESNTAEDSADISND